MAFTLSAGGLVCYRGQELNPGDNARQNHFSNAPIEFVQYEPSAAAQVADGSAEGAGGGGSDECVWAQCDVCAKWRRLDAACGDLPDRWVCALADNPYNNCVVAKEQVRADEEVVSENEEDAGEEAAGVGGQLRCHEKPAAPEGLTVCDCVHLCAFVYTAIQRGRQAVRVGFSCASGVAIEVLSVYSLLPASQGCAPQLRSSVLHSRHKYKIHLL